jgi:hypothetical protein
MPVVTYYFASYNRFLNTDPVLGWETVAKCTYKINGPTIFRFENIYKKTHSAPYNPTAAPKRFLNRFFFAFYACSQVMSSRMIFDKPTLHRLPIYV